MTSATPDKRPPLYPYELAIINCILLLLAVGAMLQDSDLGLRPKFTGILALVLVAALLGHKTDETGYRPGRATNPRLDRARNIPGWTTLVLVVLDVVAIVGVALA